ncbi:hypothetical protein DPMN_105147 [Dreissena polymorpha]|uniref:Uncharacterized protein n=1 Tax=Dreissena polymorpha TaxID=45954 RepID=A0A9D4K0N7_DREPO|nr:hypothetical protein DPMN_105147 [Dreissena polymorpha]
MLKLAQTDRPTDQQTDQQTGQKQYVPHYYTSTLHSDCPTYIPRWNQTVGIWRKNLLALTNLSLYLDILKIVPEPTMTNRAPLSLMNRLKKTIELSVSQSYFEFSNGITAP